MKIEPKYLRPSTGLITVISFLFLKLFPLVLSNVSADIIVFPLNCQSQLCSAPQHLLFHHATALQMFFSPRKPKWQNKKHSYRDIWKAQVISLKLFVSALTSALFHYAISDKWNMRDNISGGSLKSSSVSGDDTLISLWDKITLLQLGTGCSDGFLNCLSCRRKWLGKNILPAVSSQTFILLLSSALWESDGQCTHTVTRKKRNILQQQNLDYHLTTCSEGESGLRLHTSVHKWTTLLRVLVCFCPRPCERTAAAPKAEYRSKHDKQTWGIQSSILHHVKFGHFWFKTYVKQFIRWKMKWSPKVKHETAFLNIWMSISVLF